MILVQPSVSTAGSFLIKALRLAILLTPKAREIVTIAGRPSGMAATARATEARNISITKEVSNRSVVRYSLRTPTPKTTMQIPIVTKPSHLPNFFSFTCKGDSFSSAS